MAYFHKSKKKGIPVLSVIQILISFSFIEQKNVNQFVRSYWSKFADFGKDVSYRL